MLAEALIYSRAHAHSKVGPTFDATFVQELQERQAHRATRPAVARAHLEIERRPPPLGRGGAHACERALCSGDVLLDRYVDSVHVVAPIGSAAY